MGVRKGTLPPKNQESSEPPPAPPKKSSEEIEREPDLRGPAVIIEGNFLSGFKFIGPFEHVEAASQWHLERPWPDRFRIPRTIVLLVDPNKEDKDG